MGFLEIQRFVCKAYVSSPRGFHLLIHFISDTGLLFVFLQSPSTGHLSHIYLVFNRFSVHLSMCMCLPFKTVYCRSQTPCRYI